MKSITALTCVACALLILAVRLHVIARCGSPVPFWDEWDAVFSDALLPFARQHLTLTGLLAANNEHRVFLTRVFDLGLFTSEGRRWDVITEMVVMQVLVSSGAVLFLHQLGRGLRPGLRLALIGAGAALLALPFDWEGEVWAFISQMYFCVALAIGALTLIGGSRPPSARYWAGVGLALAGPFCFAGAIAALISAGTLIACRDVRSTARGPALAALAVLLAASVGLVITTPAPPVNAPLQAHTVGAFLAAAAATLSWPMPPWAGLIVWFPTLTFFGFHIIRRQALDALGWTLGALALWSILIAAEIAFARAGAPVLSRYTIFLMIAPLINLSCLFRLGSERRGLIRLALSAAWCIVVAIGSWHAAAAIRGDIAGRRAAAELQIHNVALFLRSGDETLLHQPGFAIPYGNGAVLATLLRSATEARILPDALRWADAPSGERWRKRLAKTGTLVGASGAMLGLIAIVAALRRLLMRAQGRGATGRNTNVPNGLRQERPS